MLNLEFLSKLLKNCINFATIYRPTASVKTSNLITVPSQCGDPTKALLCVTNCLLGCADEGQVSVLTIYLICQLRSIRCIIPFSSHSCTTCSAYLARLSNGLRRTCLIESRLQVSVVGSLHKRSFTTGFLKVQSWDPYSLLCTFNHCLKSFLEVGAVMTHLLMILNFTK